VKPVVEEFSWGTMRWLATAENGGTRGTSVARLEIRAGRRNELHAHPNCEEVLLLISGSVEHEVGGGTVDHSIGECVVVPAGVSHRSVNVGSVGAELVVVYGSGAREYVSCE
jgi:mannose-6-phosphate isomerase-like protein (cupin superfamily)